MTYRGIAPPEYIDLYRYQNGEITIRQRRGEHTGTGPPWHSHKTGTRIEAKARKRLAAWLKQHKITDVDPLTVPIASAPPGTRPELSRKSNLPAVIPQKNGSMTVAERAAYKAGYNAASYHVKKSNGKVKAPGSVPARDVVGALAASMNASAVILRLLQDATDDTT